MCMYVCINNCSLYQIRAHHVGALKWYPDPPDQVYWLFHWTTLVLVRVSTNFHALLFGTDYIFNCTSQLMRYNYIICMFLFFSSWCINVVLQYWEFCKLIIMTALRYYTHIHSNIFVWKLSYFTVLYIYHDKVCVLNLKQTNKYLIIPNGNPHLERKIVYYHGRRIWDHICKVYIIVLDIKVLQCEQ